MIGALQLPLLVACGALAVWLLVVCARNHVPSTPEYAALGIIQTVLLVDVVVAFVRIGQTPSNKLVYGAYLAGILVLLPFGGLWARGDETRYSSVVVILALVSVMVMLVRLDRLWHG
ncbi:MAG: hypothetical protein QOF57_1496 [Frankiaceae bacterium]|nr:hypothetical protein [Frankiaceae bacterium]